MSHVFFIFSILKIVSFYLSLSVYYLNYFKFGIRTLFLIPNPFNHRELEFEILKGIKFGKSSEFKGNLEKY